MRNVFPTAVCLSFLVLLILPDARSASAQLTLKQLQQQIRQRQGDSAPQQPSEARRPAATEQRGYLGLMLDDAKDRGRGVRVTDLRPIGPAAMGGVLKGDLITAINGVRVRQMSDVAAILGLFPPGKAVQLDVLRDGNRHSLKVTLGLRPTTSKPASTAPEPVPLPQPVPVASQPPLESPQLVPPKAQITAKKPAELVKDEEPKAQQPPEQPKSRQTNVKDLLLRIEALEKRVKQLEKALAERQ